MIEVAAVVTTMFFVGLLVVCGTFVIANDLWFLYQIKQIEKR